MSNPGRQFVLKTHNPIDLLVAPDLNPISDYEPARSGQAALPRAIQK